jgi:glutamine cyclotransferase
MSADRRRANGWGKRWAVLVLLLQTGVPARSLERVGCLEGAWPGISISPVGEEAVPVYGYEVVRVYPHDPEAFTQGLVYEGGFLYESTGLYGRSSLRKVELETGRVVKIHHLPPEFFGEGLTIWRDRLIQLTWQERTGFVYEKETFRLLRTFTYATEGWGLTHDGRHLIRSDGTAVLSFLDPETFREVRRLEVRDRGRPVSFLNELEYVRGEIYANVWQTDCLVRISPRTGRVLGWVDLTGVLGPEDHVRPVDVLNGIAYDAERDRLFVTGKLWPKLFEIRLRKKTVPPGRAGEICAPPHPDARAVLEMAETRPSVGKSAEEERSCRELSR